MKFVSSTSVVPARMRGVVQCRKAMIQFIRLILLLLVVCLSACVKESFEDVQVEVELPEPPIVYVVDCEALGLNVGDACTVESGDPALNGLPGIVDVDCHCQPTAVNAVATVTVAFWRQFGGPALTVSTVSDPPFLSGPEEIDVLAGVTEVQFTFPSDVQVCSLQHSWLCAGNVLEWSHEVTNEATAEGGNGAFAVTSVECFGIVDNDPGVE